jgi:hypothetical protein
MAALRALALEESSLTVGVSSVRIEIDNHFQFEAYSKCRGGRARGELAGNDCRVGEIF